MGSLLILKVSYMLWAPPTVNGKMDSKGNSLCWWFSEWAILIETCDLVNDLYYQFLYIYKMGHIIKSTREPILEIWCVWRVYSFKRFCLCWHGITVIWWARPRVFNRRPVEVNEGGTRRRKKSLTNIHTQTKMAPENKADVLHIPNQLVFFLSFLWCCL